MSLNEHTHPRINGSLLQNHLGKNICLLGLVKNVDRSGKSFTMTTSDKSDVQIQLQEPLSHSLSGLAEIQGKVISRNTVSCDNVVSLADATQNFDFVLYQKAIELTQRCPNYYIQGGNAED
ncbi:60S acidic ribosomal protein P1-alpha 3 [Biomphalaria glabrata]|uniref:Uncharacterized protein LOC106072880 n=1 Tax=Biomphalaria glabrata TaxID=6526 RepID=A0A9U8EI87_BIOGL|nr:uncharacterized protein LOC106072880 [Biomphalaria glabrata]KAI8755886.1 replication protein A 14 kDa subunit-like [Biomphalaria glabrata]